MSIPFLIAHGALGNADEIIFLGIAIIFIGMMGITWVRSQSIEMDDDEPESQPLSKTGTEPAQETAPDRFKLD